MEPTPLSSRRSVIWFKVLAPSIRLVAALVIAGYGMMVFHHAVNQPFFGRLAGFQPTAFDVTVFFYGLFLFLYFHWRSHQERTERLRRNTIFWIVIVLATLSYLAFISHLYDDEDKTAAIGVTVGFFATLGWIYTNYMNARHQQRAHTMNLLLSLRTNAVLNEHRINLFKRYPPSIKMTDADLADLKKDRLDVTQYDITSSKRSTAILDSVQYMANLYEFICVGMRQGDLDETIIRLSIRGILVNYYETVKPFIEDARYDETGKFLPRVYENYLHYIAKWRD